MKLFSLFIFSFFISSSILAQYTAKDKVFKAIYKSNIELFKSEVNRLEPIENSIDSVYLMDYTFDYNNEKIYESFNIVEEVIRSGSLEILEALFEIKHKFPNFESNVEGMYPLLISFNEVEKFRYILSQGIDVNVKCKVCYKQSPLLIAVNYENYPLAYELLELGADPSFKNFAGYSVLMAAVSADTFSVELFDRLILEEKVSLNDTDIDGMSALSYALYNSNIYASKKLLAEGATLLDGDQANLVISGSVQLFRQFKDEDWLKKNINTWRYYDEEDDVEYSLLDYGIMSENPKMVKLLLVDYNANANLFEDIYDNSLYVAIDFYSEEMVNVIMDYAKDRSVNKYYVKRAKKRKFSKETIARIQGRSDFYYSNLIDGDYED